MKGRFVIGFDAVEGAVVRMVGLIERRGFLLRGIAMAQQPQRASLTLDIEPRDPSRRFEVLELQLARLREVHSVSFSIPPSGSV